LQSLNRKHVSILEVQNSGHVLAQLKNLGAYYSEQRFGRADWLYLSDSDVYFLPGWMDQLTTLAVHSEWDGFKLWGGQVHPFHHPQEGGSWCLALRCRYAAAQQLHDLTMYDYSVLDGPSWLMRWSTWDSIGPLSRTCALGACQSEDAEWCSRLVASGGRIGVIQPHVVIHTGLANSNGDPAPGFAERRALIPPGVLAE
jgi:GT2 family glycosyltransferase